MRFSEFIILMEMLDPETRRNRKQMIKHFNNLKNYSKWNAEHSMEVARLVRDFSKYIGMSVKNVVAGALSHDVGKIHVDKKILHKPGKLTPDERIEMDTHAIKSAEMLKSLTGQHGNIARLMAGFHHTKPAELHDLLLKGELTEDEVELIKLVTICDIFEALTTKKRPYKESMSKNSALELMTKIEIIDQPLLKKFIHWQKTEFTNEYR